LRIEALSKKGDNGPNREKRVSVSIFPLILCGAFQRKELKKAFFILFKMPERLKQKLFSENP
jgi:hypothetical protein